MAKNLMVVESAAKAKTLAKYLGRSFQVCATGGPVLELPKTALGVDIANFRAEYRVIAAKKPVIAELRRAAADKDIVYLACDPDREGEELAWHIAELLGVPRERLRRVLFHEITPAAVKEALAHPQALNPARYDAQQARRILDRLIGSQISPKFFHRCHRPTRMQGGLPFVWRQGGLSQSVALRILVEREREIRGLCAGEPQPAQHFTRATLIEELKDKGIGRPATYATIMGGLLTSGYVTEDEARRLRPSELGMLVTDLLVEAFPDGLTVEFAAGVEHTLDSVEEGRECWVDATRRLYSPFAAGLANVATRLREAKTQVAPGPVENETLGRSCPNCGRPMQTRFGRFGRFAACTGYPECKTVQPFALPEPIGVRCPDCAQGDVVRRYTRGGGCFYACSRYPDCTFKASARPAGKN
ncbi:DNA topoisomerase 1, TOPRIM domain [uncultured Caudovirales phage]|uniref:DNA topoisomerase n=1 Tax=uncultured Caudovirales phage TaxID=2100421 RepID=A0A6J5S849_9CAUD|nr:DNA topoisomerase 1, TOPRIM domain [uncultured Caudovirales phage]CAB4205103.1 DNA topoisomerase 1, TOPRIM domain [uncultured Caudovirales phage]